MKSVLLLVHQDSGQEARVQAALDLTSALSGHLACLDVTPLPSLFDTGMALGPPVVIDQAEQEAANKDQLLAEAQAANAGS